MTQECAASGAEHSFGPHGPNKEPQCRYCGERLRACCNPDCGWQGATDRMLGSIGPLCPVCDEVTEAL